MTFELEDMATSALLPGIPERSGPPCCEGAQAPRAEAPTAGPAHSQQRAEPSWERVLQPRSGLQASAAQADVPPQPQERPWARNAQLRAPQFPTHRFYCFKPLSFGVPFYTAKDKLSANPFATRTTAASHCSRWPSFVTKESPTLGHRQREGTAPFQRHAELWNRLTRGI